MLQISADGRYIRGNRSGEITSVYALAGKGRAVLRGKDLLNGSGLKGRGTANLRRQGGKFTLRGTGYGLNGIVAGKVKLRGNSLRIRQTLRDGSDVVTYSYLVNRRAKKS